MAEYAMHHIGAKAKRGPPAPSSPPAKPATQTPFAGGSTPRPRALSGDQSRGSSSHGGLQEDDFATAATFHVSNAVRRLTADHDRLMASLLKENEGLQAKLSEALGSSTLLSALPDDLAETIDSQKASPRSVWRETSLRSSPGGRSSGERPHFRRPDPHDGELENRPAVTSNQVDVHVDGEDEIEKIEEPADAKNESAADDKALTPANETWKHRIRRTIGSGKFDTIVGAVIVANTLVMSLQLEYSGRVFEDEVLRNCSSCDARSKFIDDFFSIMEHLFTAIFALELAVRLLVEGCHYLCSVSNALDAIVVVVSMADSWILGPLGSDVMGSVAVLRLMRLMRLAKILRVVRVMKAFTSLRVLVSAVVNSVGALGWSMTLLFVLELVGAIFMAQVIQPFMEETKDKELKEFIWKHFGTWTNSMFTIFEITMAPGGFIQYRRVYEDVHPLFGIFFVLYVCVVTFAVVRVITAMFLKATLSASDSDEHATAEERSQQWTNYVRSLGPDNVDGSGLISFEDLKHLLNLHHFTKWVNEVGLVPYEVERIFWALDQGAKRIPFNQFETALRQMRGSPRAADVIINLYETRNIMQRVIRMEGLWNERFATLPTSILDQEENEGAERQPNGQ